MNHSFFPSPSERVSWLFSWSCSEFENEAVYSSTVRVWFTYFDRLHSYLLRPIPPPFCYIDLQPNLAFDLDYVMNILKNDPLSVHFVLVICTWFYTVQLFFARHSCGLHYPVVLPPSYLWFTLSRCFHFVMVLVYTIRLFCLRHTYGLHYPVVLPPSYLWLTLSRCFHFVIVLVYTIQLFRFRHSYGLHYPVVLPPSQLWFTLSRRFPFAIAWVYTIQLFSLRNSYGLHYAVVLPPSWLCFTVSRKRAHMQLVGEHSATVVSARWVTVDWSWPKEWN